MHERSTPYGGQVVTGTRHLIGGRRVEVVVDAHAQRAQVVVVVGAHQSEQCATRGRRSTSRVERHKLRDRVGWRRRRVKRSEVYARLVGVRGEREVEQGQSIVANCHQLEAHVDAKAGLASRHGAAASARLVLLDGLESARIADVGAHVHDGTSAQDEHGVGVERAHAQVRIAVAVHVDAAAAEREAEGAQRQPLVVQIGQRGEWRARQRWQDDVACEDLLRQADVAELAGAAVDVHGAL